MSSTRCAVPRCLLTALWLLQAAPAKTAVKADSSSSEEESSDEEEATPAVAAAATVGAAVGAAPGATRAAASAAAATAATAAERASPPRLSADVRPRRNGRAAAAALAATSAEESPLWGVILGTLGRQGSFKQLQVSLIYSKWR